MPPAHGQLEHAFAAGEELTQIVPAPLVVIAGAEDRADQIGAGKGPVHFEADATYSGCGASAAGAHRRQHLFARQLCKRESQVCHVSGVPVTAATAVPAAKSTASFLPAGAARTR